MSHRPLTNTSSLKITAAYYTGISHLLSVDISFEDFITVILFLRVSSWTRQMIFYFCEHTAIELHIAT